MCSSVLRSDARVMSPFQLVRRFPRTTESAVVLDEGGCLRVEVPVSCLSINSSPKNTSSYKVKLINET